MGMEYRRSESYPRQLHRVRGVYALGCLCLAYLTTPLQTIKICLDAPFSKLLSLTSNFASLPNLRKLLICVNPAQAPGTPPVPLVPFSQSSLPTPTGTPIMKSKSALPQLLGFDQMQTQTLPTSTVGDPSMPLMREVKRFVRKCPKLISLGMIIPLPLYSLIQPL